MNTKLKNLQNWPELALEAKWSAAAMAKICGVSMRTLQRHFLKEMSKNPKVWLLEQRHGKAIRMFKDGLSVKETAGSLDYKHPSHLTNRFKKQCGHCPTDKSDPEQVQSSA